MKKQGRRYFVTGLLIVLPVLITIYLFVTLFLFFDNILGRYINKLAMSYLGFKIPGLGLLLFILLIFFAGFFGTNYIGRKFLRYLESLWIRFPFVRNIYLAAKQVTRLVFSSKTEEGGFRSVVLVEFPRKGMYSLGFVMNQTCPQVSQKTSQELLSVLVATVPNPFSGFLLFVPAKEAVFLDIGVDEAIKMIVSGGLLSPDDQRAQEPPTLS